MKWKKNDSLLKDIKQQETVAFNEFMKCLIDFFKFFLLIQKLKNKKALTSKNDYSAKNQITQKFLVLTIELLKGP